MFALESDIVLEKNLDASVMRWVVDPINGRNNFMRSIPYFAINISLMENENVVAGITFDAIRGDCYKAEVGGGASIRRQRLRVSGRRDIFGALVAVEERDVKNNQKSFEQDQKIVQSGAILRKTGAVALDLAYLAAGKHDAVVARNVHFSDISSGIVLVKEAGGFVEFSKSATGKYSIIAASSFDLLQSLSKISV